MRRSREPERDEVGLTPGDSSVNLLGQSKVTPLRLFPHLQQPIHHTPSLGDFEG